MDESPLLDSAVVNGAVDYKNRPALKSNSGGWRSAAFIISVEIAERFAYLGIGANLITYLTGPLGQSTASAAANVNAWGGTVSLLPLLGAFLADSFLGRFLTILIASCIYILGLGLLPLSAIMPSHCATVDVIMLSSCSPPGLKVALFYSALYVVAVAQAGHKPCTQAFGADQFEGRDPGESEAKSSFFNWWYFGACAGGFVTTFVVTYVQDTLSWALGFGIPCVVMVIALVVFLLGTPTYRFVVSENENGPFIRIGRVFVAAFRNRREEESHRISDRQSSDQFKFLDKALIGSNEFKDGDQNSTLVDVEEAKPVVRLIPIWTTCLIYGIVFCQTSTFFTKQGATMERTIISSFKIPAASLQCFINLSIITFIPIYDRAFVPTTRAITDKPAGISVLQRVGSGIFISVFAMILAALVEIKRLETAQEYGLVDEPSATIPMSVWWLVPQYVLCGAADVFTMIGLQEFFYDQVPTELRSVVVALYLSVFGVGSFLSSFIVPVIDNATSARGRESWFSNNLNRAHLDYFYWLLAGLSALGFVSFLHFARLYIYNRKGI